MEILGFSIGLGKRVKWPDDYFTINSININRYDLEDYQTSLFDFRDGYSNNINFSQFQGALYLIPYTQDMVLVLINLEITPPLTFFRRKL